MVSIVVVLGFCKFHTGFLVSDYLNGVITGVANIYCIIVPRFCEKTFSKYFAMISNCSFLFEVTPMESLWSLLSEPESDY